jgi:hypothetical protein
MHEKRVHAHDKFPKKNFVKINPKSFRISKKNVWSAYPCIISAPWVVWRIESVMIDHGDDHMVVTCPN